MNDAHRKRMIAQLETLTASPESMEAAVAPIEAAIREALARFDVPPPAKQAALASVLAETIIDDPVISGMDAKLDTANNACIMLVRLVAMGRPN